MNFPLYEIKTTSQESHQTSPSWLVCFVRSSKVYSSNVSKNVNINTFGKSGRGEWNNDYILVKNDCTSVTINNTKSSPSKTCNLSMKVTDIDYQKAVAPGDWVFVWVSNNEQKINNFYEILLNNEQNNFSILTDKNSGFKFFGRVLNVSSSFGVNSNGIKATYQNINCQSFLELMSSVYFSYALDYLAQAQFTQSGENFNFDGVVTNFFKDASTDLLNLLYPGKGQEPSLDIVTSKIFSYLLGYSNNFIKLKKFVSNSKLKNNSLISEIEEEIKPSFSVPLDLPPMVGKILNRPASNKILDIYSFIAGIQKYNSGDANLNPQLMSPSNINQTAYKNVFYYTDIKTIPSLVFFRPPIWRNETVWNILNQYHDTSVNEMFASLRLNPQGNIGPVITVREMPFSTGLVNYIEKGSVFTIEKRSPPTRSNQAEMRAAEDALNKNRTMYYNLPRWKLPYLLIKNINTFSSDTDRVNFVQIQYVTSSNIVSALDPAQETIATRLSNFNYVEDAEDIKTNGLRADIVVSNFPMNLINESFYTVIAKKRADWSFNGHFKLKASVSCFGIEEPIAEGDNIEIGGMLFHIESITHTCQISSNGIKTFETSLQLSNGLVASSLNDIDMPEYLIQVGVSPGQGNISFDAGQNKPRFIQNNEGKKEDTELITKQNK